MPSAERLHRGHKLAGRAAVDTHRDVRKLLAQLSAFDNARFADIPVYAFESRFVDEVSGLLNRRSRLAFTITEQELYAEVDGWTFTTTIAEHRCTT